MCIMSIMYIQTINISVKYDRLWSFQDKKKTNILQRLIKCLIWQYKKSTWKQIYFFYISSYEVTILFDSFFNQITPKTPKTIWIFSKRIARMLWKYWNIPVLLQNTREKAFMLKQHFTILSRTKTLLYDGTFLLLFILHHVWQLLFYW